MKRIIALLLSIIMIVIAIAPTFTGFAMENGNSCNCGKSPIIYVIGQTTIYDDPNSPDKKSVNDIPMDKVKEAALDVAPYLLGAVAFDAWDLYCDEFYKDFAPLLTDYASLDKDGNVTDKSGITWSWSPETLKDTHKKGNIYDYKFCYDARLDPCDNADDLNDYIEEVKAVTGHSKVSIVARCLGANIAMAYLEEYASKDNYQGIDTLVLYSSALKGFSFCSNIYSGKIELEPSALSRYLDVALGNDPTKEFIKATVSLSSYAGVLGYGTDFINSIYDKVYKNVLPRLMKSSFANLPGFWSMVADEDYEDAKTLIFGDNTEEYATLINKIDNYHYAVQNQSENIMNSMKSNGVKIGIIAKYGFQIIPIVEGGSTQGDNTVDTYSQSFGATCSDVDSTLSSSYLASAKEKGTDKYISPDNQIDVSTCLYPENTWFIKNLEHNPFPDCFNEFLLELCYSETEMTVNDDPVHPQYLLYNTDASTYTALTADNSKTNDWDTSIISSLFRFFIALLTFLTEKFSNFGSEA